MRSPSSFCRLGSVVFLLFLIPACGTSDSDLFGEVSPSAGSGGVAGSNGLGGKGGSGGKAGPGGKGGSGNHAGNEQGGNEQGGNEQGGEGGSTTAGAGGNEPGGAGQGGSTTAGAGGNEPGGAGQGGSTTAGAGGDDVGGAGQGGSTTAGAGGSGAGGAGQGGSTTAGAGGSGAGGAGQGGGTTAGAGGSGAGQGGSTTAGAGGAGQGGGGQGGATTNLDQCPGVPIELKPGTASVNGNTSKLKNDYDSNSIQCGGGNSNDAVYSMTATQSGYVKVALQADDFNASLYVRSQCDNPKSLVGCDGSFKKDAFVQFSVLAGETYFIFVDGWGTNNQAGAFTLKVTLTPSDCGNGKLDPGEQCDDGNKDAGDGCFECKLDGKCSEPESENNSLASPQIAPLECTTANYFPASLSSKEDNDWFCIQAQQGQTVTAQTYTEAPGLCKKEPNNTLLELYKDLPSQTPGNVYSCYSSKALACNDNDGEGNCSRVSYKVPQGKGGLYCARVIHGPEMNPGPIPEYGILLSVK